MFELAAPFKPAGDQPQAIARLTEGILAGAKHQTLLGVTGSGKTFTIANVIQNVRKPTLVISHNKTLAAQLYAEFKGFFPNNAVEYFVSYFDYYQPEAYIPRTDTFIEKDSSRNEEIERLRLSTMSSLFARRDVVVVASVSCIYGIGSKEDYEAMVVSIRAGQEITREELTERIAWFEGRGKLLEAQRLKMRTEYDLEMMLEMGVCSGIENYSRHISARPPGSRPYTLLDFLPEDYLLVIDESHATIPQIGGMHAGDMARKRVLVEYGFRLPSALDNRPLSFEEFQQVQKQTIYVSATPGPREIEWSRDGVVELVVRPTGLIDPRVSVKPLKGQIDDLIEEARKRVEQKERVL